MNDKEYQHITDWQRKHDEKDDIRFAKMATKEEIEQIVSKVIRQEILGFGTGTYAWVKVIAVVIGSLTVIFGGFKIFLGWIGYIRP